MAEAGQKKVAVIGSRGITHADLSKFIPEDATVILSGGARGVDQLAEAYAKERGLELEVLLPDYELFGKSAPLIRDRQIVEKADLVVAIWDGSSPGTRYTIEYARQQGVPLKLYIPKLHE